MTPEWPDRRPAGGTRRLGRRRGRRRPRRRPPRRRGSSRGGGERPWRRRPARPRGGQRGAARAARAWWGRAWTWCEAPVARLTESARRSGGAARTGGSAEVEWWRTAGGREREQRRRAAHGRRGRSQGDSGRSAGPQGAGPQRAQQRGGGRRDPQRERDQAAGEDAEDQQHGPAAAQHGTGVQRVGQQRLAAADRRHAGTPHQPQAGQRGGLRRRRGATGQPGDAHGAGEGVDHEQRDAGRAKPALAGRRQAALRALAAGERGPRLVDRHRKERNEQQGTESERHAVHSASDHSIGTSRTPEKAAAHVYGTSAGGSVCSRAVPQRSLRIAQVSPYPWEDEHEVNAFVRHLADQLAARGHRMLVLAPSRSPGLVRDSRRLLRDAAREDDDGRLAPDGGVRVLGVGELLPLGPRRRSAMPSPPVDIARTIEEALQPGPVDLLHVHEPFAPSASSVALRHSRALNVGTFHAPTERVLSTQVARRFVERFFGRLDARTASFSATRDLMQRVFPADYRLVRPGARVRERPARPAGAPVRLAFVDEEERAALRLFLRALRRLPTSLDWTATVFTP